MAYKLDQLVSSFEWISRKKAGVIMILSTIDLLCGITI